MEPEYARGYRRLYDHHWWWRAREDFVLRQLDRLAPSPAEMAVLDVGCGDGLLLPRLQHFGLVEGVESDGSLITDQGRGCGGIHRVEFGADFEPGRRYDLVLMLDLLEHVDDPGAVLRRGRELLRPGGRLVVTVPAYEGLWTSHDVVNRHRTRFDPDRVRGLATASGVEVVELRHVFHWIAPAKLVVRRLEAWGLLEGGGARIPALLLNDLLRRLCIAEQILLGPLRLPFGSSLFAVLARADDPAAVNAQPVTSPEGEAIPTARAGGVTITSGTDPPSEG